MVGSKEKKDPFQPTLERRERLVEWFGAHGREVTENEVWCFACYGDDKGLHRLYEPPADLLLRDWHLKHDLNSLTHSKALRRLRGRPARWILP